MYLQSRAYVRSIVQIILHRVDEFVQAAGPAEACIRESIRFGPLRVTMPPALVVPYKGWHLDVRSHDLDRVVRRARSLQKALPRYDVRGRVADSASTER